MPWGHPSSSAPNGGKGDDGDSRLGTRHGRDGVQTTPNHDSRASPPAAPASLTDSIWEHLSHPHNWIAPIAAASLTLGIWKFYHAYLRRIPSSNHIAPSLFRRRSLLGKVTSVGDGDGFHMFHTPGGRLAGWGWLRRVPSDRKELKGRTVSFSLLYSWEHREYQVRC